MKNVLTLAVVTMAVLLSARSGSGQELFRYREYALQSSLATVAGTSGVAAADARTLHERPAKIQELKWRAPYAATDAIGADPVRDVVFAFHNDQLYQIVVTYERTRVEGLTDADLIEPLSTAYGAPVGANANAGGGSSRVDLPSDTVLVARWDNPESSVLLIRGTFSPGLQLIVTSKALYTRARTAMAEAVRLDSREAPQREIDERKRGAAAAVAAQDKARVQNKAAFRP